MAAKNKKMVEEAWECIAPILAEHRLPWSEDFSAPVSNPIEISPLIDGVKFQVDTRRLANDPKEAWQVLIEMEEALLAKFDFVTASFLDDYRIAYLRLK